MEKFEVDYEENDNSTATKYGHGMDAMSPSQPGSSYERTYYELNDFDGSFDSVFAIDSVTSSQNDYSESRAVGLQPELPVQPRMVASKNEQLTLCCEWSGCKYIVDRMEEFLKHVAYHVPELEIRENIRGEEFYGCLWSTCGFETNDPEEVKRHVNFHSYHTKIKCIGQNILDRVSNINSCTFDISSQNEIPDLPDPFVCDWEKCGTVFTNPQLFFYHVATHTNSKANNKSKHNVKPSISCQWTHCSSSFRTIQRLNDHIRTHTQEKYAACPTCGSFFASSTKLVDHVRRQTLSGQTYQCSHCSKYFSSERLLRDHMRHHVNHYKCTFCDMTCPTPSALSLHIRFKHLADKPFKCLNCTYRAKTKNDLSVHMTSHLASAQYTCEEKGCDFKCRSLYGLNKHIRKIHGDDEPTYCCHLCDSRFLRGSYLTNHLLKVHEIRWPSGHCRFRYKVDESGLYHLETVRYESLEVTQEMLRSESQPPECSVLCESQSKSKSVHITITQLDEMGNVVDANEVESDLLSSLPAGESTIIQEGSQFIF